MSREVPGNRTPEAVFETTARFCFCSGNHSQCEQRTSSKNDPLHGFRLL
jgi:hypothetical protein